MRAHRTHLLVAALMFVFVMPLCWAVDDPAIEVGVTFSATRTTERATDVSASVSTIDQEQIERLPVGNVTDLLQTLPGLHITSNGGFGGAESIILRGASNTQTLVLIDGVPVNNPMLGGSDLSNLTIDGIGRIEVVKGPYTTLWGADAMAGVVQIFTAPGARTDDMIQVGAGNYGTARADFSWGTGAGETGLGLSGSWLQTDGVRENSDYDGFTVVGRWDERVAGGLLTLTSRVYDYDLGVPGSTAFPTPNDSQNSRAWISSLAWSRESLRNRDTLRLGYWNQDIEFNYTDFFGAPQHSIGEPSFMGAGWQHDFIGDESEVSLGIDWQRFEGDFNDSSLGRYSAENDQKSVFGQVQWRPGDWRFVGSARWQDEDLFDSETTWRVGATRLFAGGRWGAWANYATGYRVPTFNELYYPGSGNPDLSPETSKSWEVGAFNELESGDVINLVYFHNDFEDLIEWREISQFVWQPVNIADATTQGVEISVRRDHGERWFERCGLSKLDWSTDGDPLLRRPDWTANYSLGFEGGRTRAQLDFVYVGDRLDAVTFPGPNEVGSYYLLNLGATHQVTDDIDVWVRANNLLDRDYEAAANYPAPGLNFTAGISTAL